MLEYVNVETIGQVSESLFWLILWLVSYVCFLALLWSALEELSTRLRLGQPSMRSVSTRQKFGVGLLLVGVMGLAVDSVLWTALFGDLGRGVGLLMAHMHGAQSFEELALLVLSTIFILVADIGSLLFLDRPLTGLPYP